MVTIAQARPVTRDHSATDHSYGYTTSHQSYSGIGTFAEAARRQPMAEHELRSTMRATSLAYLQILTLRTIIDWPAGAEPNEDSFCGRVYRRCCFCLSLVSATRCSQRVFSDIFLRVRAEAMRFLFTFATSLLKKGIRDAWIITETMVSILSVCLSVATLSNRVDIHPELSGVELALSILMLILSLMDVSFDFVPRWQRYYRNANLWLTNLIYGTQNVPSSESQGTSSQVQTDASTHDDPSNNDQHNHDHEHNQCFNQDGTIAVTAEVHQGHEAERNQDKSVPNESEHQADDRDNIMVTDCTVTDVSNNLGECVATSLTSKTNEIDDQKNGILTVNEAESSTTNRQSAQTNPISDNHSAPVTGNEEQHLPRHDSKFRTIFLKFFDPIRSFLSELLIYPLLMVTLFQFVTGQGYKPTNPVDRISLALFIMNSLFLIAGVYLVRIIMLITFVVAINKLQETVDNINIPSNPLHRCTLLMAFWTMHIIGQMITQVFLIIHIGVRIHVENSTPGESLNVSWQLLLLIIGGFFLPILGTVVFFCSVYYVVQDFSLGLYLSLLGLLERRTFPDAVFEGEGFDVKKQEELARKLIEEIHYQEVQEEYNKMKESSLFILDQVGSSYRNPYTVTISLAYSLLLCGYLSCMYIIQGQATAASAFAVISVVISNILTLSIATFWVSPPFWWVCVFTFILVGGCCSQICCNFNLPVWIAMAK